MLDKWIGKTLQNRRAELAVILVVADGRDDLVKNALLEKSGYLLIL